jgi:thiol-disulfide isomerase/thioredoxin
MHPCPGTLARLAGAALLLCACAGRGDAAEPAGKLPRYHLQVGQELVYSGSSTFKHQSGQFTDKDTWHVWVTRANPDGSWRLIIRFGSAFSQGKSSQPESVTFAYCDLFPDGRIVDNDSFGFHMRPTAVLPLLPRDESQARQGWTGRDARMDETFRYRLLPGEPKGDRLVIEVARDSPMNAIYGFSFKDRIIFDTKRGLVEKIENESRQSYGFKGEGHGTLKLGEVKTHDADWCRQLNADADRYFAVQEANRRAAADQARPASETKAALEKAKAALKAVRADLKLLVLQKAVDIDLANQQSFAKYTVEEAEYRAAVLNKPAADWSTTDLDGKPHALKDYRGKVVILDFWYRGCGWCICSMPQLKEIVAHFKGRPVVFFGMNTDRKLEDAQFVVDKMGLNYTNLKAEGLPKRYEVRGFPTLVIIDQQGIVRDMHVGYSPTLRDEVIQSVERLLKEQS